MNAYPSLAFVGGGNMARSIIGGLIANGWPVDRLTASDPSADQRTRLEHDFGVATHADNNDCCRTADVVVMAVKPQMMRQVLGPLGDTLKAAQPLLISVAAGIRSEDMLRWAGAPLACIRVMPNTPALVNEGVSGLFATAQVTDTQRDIAGQIMSAVGKIVWVDSEALIDTVTGVSGSGPAYYFKLMELMIQSAVDNGLDRQSATTLVLQTALGAARLAGASEHEPAELRRQVTSPNGTTQAGLEEMERQGIDDAVQKGVRAAIERSIELADTLGQD